MIKHRQGGFTLIELLVALFVFAILALTAYRGLTAVTQTRAHLERETRKWQALERFFMRLDFETSQALARPVRTASGALAPAWIGSPSSGNSLEDAQLAFTHGGGYDAGGMPMPPQRVAYRLRQNRLEMLRWRALDSAPSTSPSVDTVLEGVREFNVRELDSHLNWQTQWPPLTTDNMLPKGVEVHLVLISGETLTRFFALQ